jgi:hypothetical protein
LILLPKKLLPLELTWSSIRHAQQERLFMNLLKVLILKLFAVDTLTTSAVALCEIAALDHKALDDAVEARAFVVKWFAGCAYAFLAGTG